MRILSCLVLTLAASCGGAAVTDALIACGTDGSCPAGFLCASDNTCWKPPAPPPPLPPQAPANLKGDRTAQGIALTWDPAPRATSYVVRRQTVGVSSPAQFETADHSFLDTAVTRPQSYSYVVAALGPGGTGPGSFPVVIFALPPAPPPPSSVTAVPGTRQIDLFWTGGGGVLVFRSATAGGPYTQIGAADSIQNVFSNTGLADGTRYFYVLRSSAFDGFPSDPSAEVSATTAPPPPANLTATLNPDSRLITVSWDAVPGADGYCVKDFETRCREPLTSATTLVWGPVSTAVGIVDLRVSALALVPNPVNPFVTFVESVDAGPVRVFLPFPARVAPMVIGSRTSGPDPGLEVLVK